MRLSLMAVQERVIILQNILPLNSVSAIFLV
jgi:hypothetical protein